MINLELSSFLKNIKDSVLKQEFAEIGTLKTFNKGNTIVQDGTYIKSIPIILRGGLKVVQEDDEGREFLLYYLAEGESCIMSILGGLNNEPSKVSVIAEKDTDILLIPIQNAAAWVKKYPAWTEYIFKLYQKRFEEMLSIVKKVSTKSLTERLTDLLLVKSKLAQSKTLSITHQQLADELGTARVVVSRLLKQMENAGKITLSRNSITLLSLV
jgi:CRP/FNR family transcriptional regulator, anaerobic regulatory protein